jgi:hypothetical protein
MIQTNRPNEARHRMSGNNISLQFGTLGCRSSVLFIVVQSVPYER